MADYKLTDNEIIKALERLKNTNDYLKEQYQEQVKKCPYPELKPIAKQTYEDNKKAFDIAIKAIEEFNRLQAQLDKYERIQTTLNEFWDMLLKLTIAKRKEKPTLEEFAEAIHEIEVEAYKECIEKVKMEAENATCVYESDRPQADNMVYHISNIRLDNLLKEKVSESNAET